MAGTACFTTPLHNPALVYPDVYVYARGSNAYPFQYALAVLVRCFVPKFLLRETFTGRIYLGRNLWRTAYMAAYNIFPYFRPMTEYSFMLGASASVLAVVAATAYREPNYPIRLFLFGTIRLKYLALIVIGTDLLFITSSNAGGHIAHLGGALAGLWFAASLSKGADITVWINKSLDAVSFLFSSKPRKPKMKVHYGTDKQKDYNYNARKKLNPMK